MKKFEAEHGIGDRVVIMALEGTISFVEQVCFAHVGVTYQVSWFHEGDRKTAWVLPQELKAADRY